jgi:hypothetical protein
MPVARVGQVPLTAGRYWLDGGVVQVAPAALPLELAPELPLALPPLDPVDPGAPEPPPPPELVVVP